MQRSLELTALAVDQIQADDSDNVVAGDGPTLMGVTGTLLALSCLVVAMRCWARQVILRTFGWDDAAMLLALGLAAAGFASFAGLCRAGGGRRADRLSPRERADFRLYSVLAGLCCVAGICLVKASVGLFLRRVVPRPRRRLVDAFLAFMLAYTVYSVLTFALICVPLAAYWDAGATPGTCWSARTLEIVGNLNAALNVTTDAFTWLLPLQVIMKLQVNRRTKISLAIIMSLGLLSIVASVARVIFGSAWQWSTDLYLWLNIEVTIAILSASLPCLRPIFTSFLGSTAGPHSSSSSPLTPGRSRRLRTTAAADRSSRRRSGYARQSDGGGDDVALASRGLARHGFRNSSKKEQGLDDGYGFSRRSDNLACEARVSVSVSVAGAGRHGDDGSEDGMLLPARPPPVGGITKTTEIFISKV